MEKVIHLLRDEVDPSLGMKGWAKVYTNGTLLNLNNILELKEMGLAYSVLDCNGFVKQSRSDIFI